MDFAKKNIHPIITGVNTAAIIASFCYFQHRIEQCYGMINKNKEAICLLGKNSNMMSIFLKKNIEDVEDLTALLSENNETMSPLISKLTSTNKGDDDGDTDIYSEDSNFINNETIRTRLDEQEKRILELEKIIFKEIRKR